MKVTKKTFEINSANRQVKDLKELKQFIKDNGLSTRVQEGISKLTVEEFSKYGWARVIGGDDIAHIMRAMSRYNRRGGNLKCVDLFELDIEPEAVLKFQEYNYDDYVYYYHPEMDISPKPTEKVGLWERIFG